MNITKFTVSITTVFTAAVSLAAALPVADIASASLGIAPALEYVAPKALGLDNQAQRQHDSATGLDVSSTQNYPAHCDRQGSGNPRGWDYFSQRDRPVLAVARSDKQAVRARGRDYFSLRGESGKEPTLEEPCWNYQLLRKRDSVSDGYLQRGWDYWAQ
ncbi:hypothetical protein DL89DRAFT_313008 [Linderina pennispora]|uniref:Uncharacterized protein n=1 Tax=Linderina pennispora TaxID=61395 RepID=A0A1Y1WCW0_9FUNG|nr:uncharacterized protein DL89DRAFT_313008 [Linderina pennispora]ORX71066.1 hypothetical protein DL89DRAFT_313008 [Linderina pennispora]